MKAYNIDTSYTEFSNEAIYLVIKNIIKENTYDTYKKVLLVSHCINYITDPILFNNTIQFLKDCGWYKTINQFEKPLYNIIDKIDYSQNDRLRITTIVYSAVLDYELFMKYWFELIESNVPKLRFNIIGKEVLHNLEDISKEIQRKSLLSIIERNKELLSVEEQINELKEMINTMSLIDYNNETDVFDRDIKYLEILKGNITELKDNIVFESNPHPSIFEIGGYEIFEKWMVISKDNTTKKLSFIFQKLKKEDKLRKTGLKPFSKWAYEKGFISKNEYYSLLEKGYFDSPSKILTKNRLALYNSIVSQ